jgi:hypothetical protein
MNKFISITKSNLAKYGFSYVYSITPNKRIHEGVIEIITWMVQNVGESNGNNWFIRIYDNELKIYFNDQSAAVQFKLVWG